MDAAAWAHIHHHSPLKQQTCMQQHPRLCHAALPAALDGLAAVSGPLQQDQVAALITAIVALVWVKLFDVLTNAGVLEQVSCADCLPAHPAIALFCGMVQCDGQRSAQLVHVLWPAVYLTSVFYV